MSDYFEINLFVEEQPGLVSDRFNDIYLNDAPVSRSNDNC